MDKELNIYQKLNNFNTRVGAIVKDKTNPHFRSSYADINNVLEVIREPLSTAKLIAIQTTKQDNDKFYLNTKIINIDNPDEFLEIDIPLIYNGDMQKLGSAITYARRYALITILGLETEDDDGNLASGYNKNQAPQQKQPQPQRSASVKEKFVAMLLGNNLKKEEFTKFMEFMMDIKGVNLQEESEKMKLISNISLLKQFITEFEEYANQS